MFNSFKRKTWGIIPAISGDSLIDNLNDMLKEKENIMFGVYCEDENGANIDLNLLDIRMWIGREIRRNYRG